MHKKHILDNLYRKHIKMTILNHHQQRLLLEHQNPPLKYEQINLKENRTHDLEPEVEPILHHLTKQ